MIYVSSVFKILRKKNEKATRFKNFHIFRGFTRRTTNLWNWGKAEKTSYY